MARGWESKSVEEQIESANARRGEIGAVELTPEQITQQRAIESLQLSRTRVLHDLEAVSHPRRREQLEAALLHLESKLKELQ